MILLRHTRPAVAEGMCYGRSDLALGPDFEAAAAAVLANLPEVRRVVSSPLGRCRRLAERIAATRRLPLAEDARLVEFDSTVSTAAVISGLYDRLPANGSELVLYDVNRAARIAPMLRPAALADAARLAPAAPRPYRTVVVGNAGPGAAAAVERMREAGGADEAVIPLGVDYPADIFSLSHVALPFPPWDGLYGYAPDGRENFGIALGSLTARGETGTLTVSLDQVGRLTSNPFHAEMLARIGQMIDAEAP